MVRHRSSSAIMVQRARRDNGTDTGTAGAAYLPTVRASSAGRSKVASRRRGSATVSSSPFMG